MQLWDFPALKNASNAWEISQLGPHFEAHLDGRSVCEKVMTESIAKKLLRSQLVF